MAPMVVPRLMARLRHERHTAPLGEAVWQETTLLVPGPQPQRGWRHLLTGVLIRCVETAGQATLVVAELCAPGTGARLVAACPDEAVGWWATRALGECTPRQAGACVRCAWPRRARSPDAGRALPGSRGEAVIVASPWPPLVRGSLVVNLEGVMLGLVVVCLPCLCERSSLPTELPQPQES